MAFARSVLALAALGTFVQVQAGCNKGLLARYTEDGPRQLAACDPKCDPWKCKDHCDFQGFLPIFSFEKDIPNPLRLIMYLVGLAWTFLGIAIISDIFMAGIEKVTSWKKRVKDKASGRTITIYVWNATVANLTLMALGSSAPEILLSLIEIIQNQMFLGDLGAGTIVGSAAFNLLVISAVCVLAIPDPEVRYIKQTTVYAITASCSVLAYSWLMVILMVFSPNVCTKTEALATLIFCPLMVFFAFLADKGLLPGQQKKTQEDAANGGQTIPDDVTPDELAMIEQQIREIHGSELSPEQVVNIMQAKYFTNRSRAYYRRAALRMTIAGPVKKRSILQRLSMGPAPDLSVKPVMETSDNVKNDKKDMKVLMGFESARYAFLEDCGYATLYLTRTGPTHCKATVKYKTRDGTATSSDDYEPHDGVIVFEKDQTRQALKIKIYDDNAYEENEEFYVDLTEPTVEDSASCSAQLSEINSVVVVIIDDDDPGVIRWKVEEVTFEEEVESTEVELVVERIGGASGKITCKYETEDMNAVAGADYEYTTGIIELEPAVQSAIIKVPIKPKGRFEKTSSFLVNLTDATGCVFDKDTDGGEESCICHITIKGKTNDTRVNVLKRMESKIHSQQVLLGHRHWRQQFMDALFKVGDDDDDEDEENDDDEPKKKDDDAKPKPSWSDYAMHVISLPWKIIFAFVPPPDYCGGWACFFGSLLMIAVVTGIVGDMANLVGCCMKIEPEITAITFVALGTSLPDTFASKTAAVMDPYADASIGNITGSNSVNVFIGLGLSWTLASFYWSYQKPSQEWLERVFQPPSSLPGQDHFGMYYEERNDILEVMSDDYAVFVTPSGTLWFNLGVFSLNAFFAIQHLWARRRKFGGELGGPKWGFMGQYFSAVFLVFQWVIYITASSIWATIQACK